MRRTPFPLLTLDAARSSSLLAYYAAPIPEPSAADIANPKWVQLCSTGSYVYRDQPTTITGETFDRMVANFRAHPAYRAEGRALFGMAPDEAGRRVLAGPLGVVALNFDHPPPGAPRPGHGWFLELERRGEQLWGLCWFDAEAHEGMRTGRWKWTSIEWGPRSMNNRGEEIGPYLSGVALTNDPFITGMVPIQMAAGHAQGSAGGSGVLWFGPATDVLCELRCLFGLPETADVAAVIGEVAKLRAWALGQSPAPLGVDVGQLVAQVRGLLNLPTLADPASIFAELDKLLGALADEQEKETPAMPEKNPTDQNTSGTLGLSRLLAGRLSAKLGRAVDAEDNAVVMAFDAMSGRYDEAMGHVQAMQKMFGTSDPKAIADKLSALIALGEQMTSLLGEVAAEHVAEEQAEGQMAAQDVQAVMQAQRLDPTKHSGTVQAYTAQRLGFAAPLVVPTAADAGTDPAKVIAFFAAVRKRREARATARADFLKAHGIEGSVQVPQHLQHLYGRSMFVGAGATYSTGNAPAPAPGAVGYQGAPLQFAAGQNGAPPAPNTWNFARVQSLPPGPNDGQRIFEEVVRSELGNKAPVPGTQAYNNAWARVSEILRTINQS